MAENSNNDLKGTLAGGDAGLMGLLLDPDKDREWVETFLSVPSEDQGLVDWKVTQQQDKIIDFSRKIRRGLIIKGRQTRCSTILMAKAVRKSTQVYGHNFVIVTQTDQMTQNFRTFILDRLEELAGFGLLAKNEDERYEKNNTEVIRLRASKNSFHFASAAQKVGLRGIQTAHWVHASEVAFWDDGPARKIIGGLLPAVPANGNFFAESTPNGAAGWFYDQVMDSMPLVEQSIWTTAFFPWWLEKTYTVSNPTWLSMLADAEIDVTRMRMDFSPNPQEEALMAREGLDLNQMLWRRFRTRELMQTGQYFAQEYPEDMLSCWLSAGVNFFHDDLFDHLGYYRDQVQEPRRKLRELPYHDPVTGGLSNIDFLGANLHIWEDPQPAHRYVAFQDVSAGVAVEGDYSALAIIDAETYKHVATLRVRTLPDRVGRMAAAVGAYYNWAFLGIERNSYGVGAITAAQELHYPNLYYDVVNQPQKPEIGWFTGQGSRELMLNNLRSIIFSHRLDTRDRMCVLEMGGFSFRKVQGRTGNVQFRAEAEKGNDDLVIALAGACTIAPYAPRGVRLGRVDLSGGRDVSVDANGIVQRAPRAIRQPWLSV
jgi:hypothetical protein